MNAKILFYMKFYHSGFVLIFIILLYIFQQKFKVEGVDVKKTKFLIFVFVLVLFLFPGCDKKDNIIDENGERDLIVGAWNSTGQSANILLTLNSSQDVVNLSSPGIDSLTVSGSYNSVLKYIYPVYNELLYWAKVTNKSYHLFYDYPFYDLLIFIMTDFYSEAVFTAYLSESEQYEYNSNDFTVNINPDTYTLTIEHLVLDDVNRGSVIIRGSITPSMITIPANFPMSILNININEELTIICNPDGSYSRLSPGIEDGESGEGTWEVIGDSIISPTPPVIFCSGFAIRPRMPANCRICMREPLAPDSAIIYMGLNPF